MVDDPARALGELHRGAEARDVGGETGEQRLPAVAQDIGGACHCLVERCFLSSNARCLRGRRTLETLAAEPAAGFTHAHAFRRGGDGQVIAGEPAKRAGDIAPEWRCRRQRPWRAVRRRT